MLEYIADASGKAELVSRNLRPVGAKDFVVMHNVKRGEIALNFVLLVARSSEALDGSSIASMWQSYSNLVQIQKRSWNHRGAEPTEEAVKELRRVFNFACSVDRTRFHETLPFVRPVIEKMAGKKIRTFFEEVDVRPDPV